MLLKPTDKHILVNYHYIEDPRSDRHAFHPCPVEKFKEQIAWLSTNFTFVSVEDVFKVAHKQSTEKYCAITFDDGLKDQYQNAVPILKKYGATAAFFPITGTFEGFVPSTHKIHLLLSTFSANELVDKSNIFLQQRGSKKIAHHTIPKDHRITLKRKMRDDVVTANLKETINRLPNDIEKELLDWLFKTLKLDEKSFAEELFMNKNELSDLIEWGFELGCHTHHHYALDTQSKESMRNELRLSKKYLENITGKPLTLLAYPHGGVNDDVIQIAQDEGLLYGLTIERGAVQPTNNPFLIPRYDVNDIVIH